MLFRRDERTQPKDRLLELDQEPLKLQRPGIDGEVDDALPALAEFSDRLPPLPEPHGRLHTSDASRLTVASRTQRSRARTQGTSAARRAPWTMVRASSTDCPVMAAIRRTFSSSGSANS